MQRKDIWKFKEGEKVEEKQTNATGNNQHYCIFAIGSDKYVAN